MAENEQHRAAGDFPARPAGQVTPPDGLVAAGSGILIELPLQDLLDIDITRAFPWEDRPKAGPDLAPLAQPAVSPPAVADTAAGGATDSGDAAGSNSIEALLDLSLESLMALPVSGRTGLDAAEPGSVVQDGGETSTETATETPTTVVAGSLDTNGSLDGDQGLAAAGFETVPDDGETGAGQGSGLGHQGIPSLALQAGSAAAMPEDVNPAAGDGIIHGTAGDDTLDGTVQNDRIVGHAGNDTLNGNNGQDTLWGGAGNDTLNGENGKDALYGEDGDDTLDGGNGKDTLHGGAGNDTLVWDNADDVIDGGDGTDTLRVDSGNVKLTAFSGAITGIETIDLATDAGANKLTLTAQDVLDMSDAGTVTVNGDAADSIAMGAGWTDGGSIGGFHTFTQMIGADTATLIVDDNIAVL